jgi:hypothetical protein
MQNAVAQHVAENRATSSRVAGSAVVSEGHTPMAKSTTLKMAVFTDRGGCVVRGVRNWKDIHAAHLALGLG